jgi:hypothetical protein
MVTKYKLMLTKHKNLLYSIYGGIEDMDDTEGIALVEPFAGCDEKVANVDMPCALPTRGFTILLK